MKRVEISMGPFTFITFQLREGAGIKLSSTTHPLSKHLTILTDAMGAMGLHETREKFPLGHPKRNKHVWTLDLAQAEKHFTTSTEMQTFFLEALPKMLNPDLSGLRFLALPMYPSDLSGLLTVKGRKGTVHPHHLETLRVLDADDLPTCKHRIFFVLRKARTWWHSDGFLLKPPNNEFRLLIDTATLKTVFQCMLGNSAPPKSLEHFPLHFKLRDRDLQALQSPTTSQQLPAESQTFVREMLALYGVSAHMMFGQTGLLNRLLDAKMEPASSTRIPAAK
ncbi:MAG: hypothetical protein HY922_00825 [Elusimicrobia bacterium]|nr:hypothetical protein [Elusimicrobiota bacterium]